MIKILELFIEKKFNMKYKSEHKKINENKIMK